MMVPNAWLAGAARKHAALVILMLVLGHGGCATVEQFQQSMDAHLGQSIVPLRERFGYNYIERKLDEETLAYTWTWIESGSYPGYRTPEIIRTIGSGRGTRVIVYPDYYFPPEYYEYVCEMTFILDSRDVAIGWRAHGNGCRGAPGPPQALKSN